MLSLLNLSRLFNKNKETYYKEYGVLPAYPTAQLIKDENFEQAMAEFYEKIESNMDAISAFKAVLYSIDIIKDLQENLNSFETYDGQLTYDQLSSVVEQLERFNNIMRQCWN